MCPNKQGDLGRSAKLCVSMHDPPQRVTVRNDDEVRRWNCQHVLDHPVDVLVSEAVSKGDQRAVWATDRRGKITKEFDIGVSCCLPVLRCIGVNHQIQGFVITQSRGVQVGLDFLTTKWQPDLPNLPLRANPIQGAM